MPCVFTGMEKLVTISVTENDLAKGKVGTTDESAVALAAARAFPGCRVSEALAVLLVYPPGGGRVFYEIPAPARALTEKLERGQWEWAEPITFEVTRWDRPPHNPEVYSTKWYRWTA